MNSTPYTLIADPNAKEDSVYTPRGAAADFLYSKDPEVIIHGPAETGKTIAACWKLHLVAMKYPEAQLVIARKLREDIYASVLQTYLRVIAGSPVRPFGGGRPERYEYPNGSVIWIAGLDRPGKVLSSEKDIIYVNQAEELRRESWETITTRTTGRGAVMPYTQAIGDCNPDKPDHWILARAEAGYLNLIKSSHHDNPTLFDEKGNLTKQGERTMRTLNALTGVRKKRLRDGLWVAAEGIIYDEYDEPTHRIYKKKLPVITRWVGGVDWGYSNPGVLGLWGLDRDDNMYLMAQIYHTGKTVDWFIEKAHFLEQKFHKAEAWVCDPSQPAYIKQFQEAKPKLNAIKGFNDVLPGIDGVKVRLQEQRLFFVHENLYFRDQELDEKKLPYCTEKEVDGYIWANRASKDVPVKENDHGLDMTRYVVCYVDDIGGKRKKKVRAIR